MVETPTELELALAKDGARDDAAITSFGVQALVNHTPEDIEYQFPRGELTEEHISNPHSSLVKTHTSVV